MTAEEWIDVVAGACRARVEAIKLYRRYGAERAIAFLRSVPGTNKEALALMERELANQSSS